MRSVLGNFSFAEHEDTVELGYGREAVSDHDAGTAFHELVEAGLDELFALAIEGTSGFVQHKDRRVFENCPGDGDALSLAARELDTPFADDSIEAFW